MQACRGLRRAFRRRASLHRRRVLDESITYVGLDVHKDTIAVALAETGAHKDVRKYGKIANTAMALNALAAKLSRAGSELRFCYEAGPCGYGIQRQLTLAGHGCVVVAPSLIPRKPGDRIKTDRRDAINLAKLHRAGELTAVWIPDQAHEAIRDLVRARLAAVRSLRQARQQLSGFLLRHGRHYNRPAWTLMHRRWMAGLRFEQAAHLSKAEQGWRHGHGQENPRVHYQPDIFRRWRLDRGSSATHHRSGGIQPAHQSMINRRFDDRASCPAQSRPF